MSTNSFTMPAVDLILRPYCLWDPVRLRHKLSSTPGSDKGTAVDQNAVTVTMSTLSALYPCQTNRFPALFNVAAPGLTANKQISAYKSVPYLKLFGTGQTALSLHSKLSLN